MYTSKRYTPQARAIRLDRFKRRNDLLTLSIKSDDDTGETPDPQFSSRGCDVCNDGLGNSVYECHGYSPTHDQVFDGFEVCGECICIEYNGVDRD